MVFAHTDRHMRADRLLSILLLLQTQGRLTARSLADRLEVSERTVHRDMEALAMAGVPVWAQTGRGGGWELAEDYRTDLTGLTEAELRSLVVAGAPTVLAGLGLGEAFDRAITKVLATLPATRRDAATASRAYLHVDPTGWRRTEDAAPWLPTLDAALRTGRRIAITYERAYDQRVVERTVDPLGLVAKGSTWYLLAVVDGATRTYRASRLRHVEVLADAADRPSDLDLAAAWSSTRDAFQAALPAIDWTMRCSPRVIDRIRLGWRFARLVDEDAPDPDGWVTARFRADSVEVAVECALGLGAEAEVVSPADIAERVLAGAHAVVARSGGTAERSPAKSRVSLPS
jgi:predicted DNA-binding transcriptional regulator YafY